jgi:hypothetical protein
VVVDDKDSDEGPDGALCCDATHLPRGILPDTR